jgi:hypothetical protein
VPGSVINYNQISIVEFLEVPFVQQVIPEELVEMAKARRIR